MNTLTLTDAEREAISDSLTFTYADGASVESAVIERILAARVTEARADALREAADWMDSTAATAWGGDASWLTTGRRVSGLVSGLLRERADDEVDR
jgi:hypothetical protein